MSLVTNRMEAGEGGVDRGRIAEMLSLIRTYPQPKGDGSDMVFFVTYPTTRMVSFAATKTAMRHGQRRAMRSAQDRIEHPLTNCFTPNDALIDLMHGIVLQGDYDAKIGRTLSNYAWALHAITESMREAVPPERLRFCAMAVQNGRFGLSYGETAEEMAEALVMQRRGHAIFGTARKGN